MVLKGSRPCKHNQALQMGQDRLAEAGGRTNQKQVYPLNGLRHLLEFTIKTLSLPLSSSRVHAPSREKSAGIALHSEQKDFPT
eukprot:1147586-Pelagomonas_calceolata.AAC.4